MTGGIHERQNALMPISTNKVNAADRDTELPIVSVNDIPTAPVVCPGAQPPDNDPVNRFASEIDHEWRKSVQSILKVAERCAEACRSLGHPELSRLYKALPFDRTMFSKLAAIGKNKALTADKIRDRLPANWTILHLLRNCTEEDLSRAISEGQLYPGVPRSDLSKWLSGPGRKKDKTREELDARHAEQLADLQKAFLDSPEVLKVWRRSPDVVRKRFFQLIMRE